MSQAGDLPRGMAIDELEADLLLRDLAIDLAPTATRRSEATPADASGAFPSRREDESPLRRVRRVFHLQTLEYDALLLALAIELDSQFARLVAYLNYHIARTRPTVGLLRSLNETERSTVEFCQRRAVRFGLLRVEGEGPLSGLAVRVAKVRCRGSQCVSRPSSCPGLSLPRSNRTVRLGRASAAPMACGWMTSRSAPCNASSSSDVPSRSDLASRLGGARGHDDPGLEPRRGISTRNSCDASTSSSISPCHGPRSGASSGRACSPPTPVASPGSISRCCREPRVL